MLEETEYDISGPTPVPLTRIQYTIGDDVISQTKSTLNGSAWTANPTQYLLYDGHGSTRQLVSPSQTIVASYSYDAYGVMLGSAANPADTAQTKYLYAGEQYDSSVQQYYNRARYYNPSNGLFNRVDPYSGNLHDPQSLHKYLYCHANPVNGIDPTGMFGDFTFSGLMMNMAIQAMLTYTIMPAISPIINQVVTAIGLPKWLENAIVYGTLPSAILFGVGITVSAGYYIGGGIVGLAEALIFPSRREVATFKTTGWAVGLMSGGGAGATGSAYAGLVWGANHLDDYAGPFRTINVSYRSLNPKLKKAINNFIEKSVWDLHHLDFSVMTPEAFQMICRDAKKAVELFGAKSNLVVSFFTDPNGTVGGFSLGVDLSLGKGLNHSITFTESEIWGGPWSY